MNHQQPNFDNLSLFQKLQQELARIIEETPAGERLQSEPELASSLGVSRATLREAMRSFEGQGLIRRRQGVGTFVLDHQQNIETGLEVLESIETQARRIGLDVKMGYLDINKIKSDVELAKKLGI
ncbi:MAG: GntR family transcriptional regulator, partial [Flexilinea flocculi]|nr:GntR family transcriptional regulator [Flexilinea flocculi]